MLLASLRLAIALVCVGASLLLGAHWLGLVPDSEPIAMRARESLSTAIAVNSTAHIRKRQWGDLQSTLVTLVDQHPELLSVGIRDQLGALRTDTGKHHEIWSRRENQRGRISTYRAPITLNRKLWGYAELCFRNPHESAFATALHHPLLRLLAFFCVAGVFVYAAFVLRVMRLFHSTQVVPDRVHQALDTLTEGLLVLDEKGRIVLANRSFSETIGITASELTQTPASDLCWIRPGDETPLPWTLAIETCQLQSDKMLRYRQSNGDQRIFSVNAAPLGRDGSQRGALATFRDVTHVEEHRAELEKMLSLLRSSRDEIKRKNSELEILATQDSLTGCLNRRAFFERYDRYWAEAQAEGGHLACVMIDIDHFKTVNDSYGHYIGDEVLRRVSSVIREMHRDHALVCRYGGEEFCLVFPFFDLGRAIEEAEKTRAAISAIEIDDPTELKLTASIGVTERRFEANDPQDLINQADLCLYVAKRQGRDQVVSYNPSLLESVPDEADPIQRLARRIEIPYQAVTALVSALSYRDINTAEHSRRVADLCSRAADGILDPEQTYVLEIAALLHDIGKIGVPDHILLKPGPLTRDEWELMGRHDRIGVEIIASAFDCPELSLIISTHHSYYGGSSRSPHLPVGDDIPLGARILTIADSYDAMVSDRVYRKGRSHDEAIQELRRCAGTQFDPALVEHFAKKIEANAPRVAQGALSLRKQTALQIGQQVECLAHAIDTQDAEGLRMLSSRLGMIARSCDIEAIADAAEKIERLAGEQDVQWLSLLRDTHKLLDMCRSTQSTYLRETLEFEVRPRSVPR